MKLPIVFVLLPIALCAQNSPDAKIITFRPADAAHCRVIQAGGKPLLETSYNGVSVAVGMPENRGNGEFAVYVSIAQVDPGTARVVPRDFSALFSDADHTRFTFFDKAAELAMRAPDQPSAPGMSATTNDIDRSMMRGGPPQAGAAGPSPSDTLRGDNLPASQASPAVPPTAAPVFLQSAKVKQGSKAAGFVFFRKPKGSKLEVHPGDMLGEIDLPINGVVFRF